MRRQSWATYGLIAVFLALYVLSMFLPGMVVNSPDKLHENPSVEEVTAFLKQGADCWIGLGVKLHLDRDNAVVDEHGSRLSGAAPPSMACRGQPTKTTYWGYRILLDGWLGIFFSIFAWYANVLAVIALILALIGRSPKTAAGFAGAAFVLGFDAFRLHTLPMISYGPSLPETVDYLASGYYVWEVSLLVLLLSQIVTIRTRRLASEQSS